MKFTDEDKEVKDLKPYFAFGVHNIKIAGVQLGKTDAGAEFLEITVTGKGGEEDTARVWFSSPKATNYSFNIMRAIYIHNTPEANRDKARELFDKLNDTDELAKVVGTLVGKEAWFTKYVDPNRTYTAQDGQQRQSVNKNIYGYEPKLKAELLPKDGPVDLGALGVGQAESEVPFESAGDAPGSHVPDADGWGTGK